MRLPPRPDLHWKDDGTPVDSRIDDVYFSVADGLAESRAVFLAGCRLPEAWSNSSQFTIAELGFGTGLNFLATWQMWQQTRPNTGWLNFVSFEGYPLDREDIDRALRPWPELGALVQKLCALWPVRAKGVRQIIWPEERLILTLHVGLIEETLPRSEFLADAWFLDGFSPAKNQAMWADALWPEIAARSRPGARVATFTVAGAVRRGLASVGFEVEKQPGFGRKRERLEAQFFGAAVPPSSMASCSPSIAVIGAGIAGSCLARALCDRGANVRVFDKADGPARGASGNPLALVMPRLDASDTTQARLLIDAYLSAQSFYAGRPGVTIAETVHRPRDAAESSRFEKVLADPPLGLEQLEALNGGGLLHKGSLIIEPARLISNLLDGIDVAWESIPEVDTTARTVNGQAFDAIIFANGWRLQDGLPELALTGRLGQIEWLNSTVAAPASALAAGPYAVANGTKRLWGATFANHPGGDPQTSSAAQAENQDALRALAPYWWREALSNPVQSRAGVRATTPDRLPLIGLWPDIEALRKDRQILERAAWKITPDDYGQAGVFVVGGFGSRGFTWAPWAAQIVRALIFRDAVPTSAPARLATVPIRHALRSLKRKTLA